MHIINKYQHDLSWNLKNKYAFIERNEPKISMRSPSLNEVNNSGRSGRLLFVCSMYI